MGTVSYTVFDGEVTSEYRNGVLKSYVVDPLGSTIALIDNTQTITDTFSYSAFGEVVNRTGTTPTPFQYVGSKGYYRDSNSRTHVRARNFYVNLGKWSTQDPLWFGGGDWNLYRYVGNNPLTLSDRLGLFMDDKEGLPQVCSSCSNQSFPNNDSKDPVGDALKWICDKVNYLGDDYDKSQSKFISIAECVKANIRPKEDCPFTDPHSLPPLVKNLMKLCNSKDSKVVCDDAKTCGQKKSPCGRVDKIGVIPCTIHLCTDNLRGSGCRSHLDDTIRQPFKTLLHEMLHCAGVKHGRDTNVDKDSCNEILACCIINATRPPNSRKRCVRL